MKKYCRDFCTLFACVAVMSTSLTVSADNSVNIGRDSFILNSSLYSDATGRMYDDSEGVGGFVSRLYRIALGREYEEAGYLGWCDKLAEQEENGGDVARGFILSDEFKGAAHSDEEFVNILYRVFFDREPDDCASGWVDKLADGTSRADILDGFIDSAEWTNVCNNFGIRSGASSEGGTSTGDEEDESDSGDENSDAESDDSEGDGNSEDESDDENDEAEVSEGICTFVRSLYQDCLGRNPDDFGFDGWTRMLAKHETTGKAAAYGFFFSPEFAAMTENMENEAIIDIFYKVFLNRTSDPEGKEFWLSKLSWGYDPRILFEGFADSSEFSQKCELYGIECGDSIEFEDEDFIEDENFLSFANYAKNQSGMDNIEAASYVGRDYYYVYNEQNNGAPQETYYISNSEKKILQKFADEHFNPSWSNGQKALYTLFWINRNVTYSAAQGDYCASVFENRVGQCAQYNGALLSMMTYLGYDVSMIRGYRGYPDNKWTHYWGEIYINGEVYVLECGNYNQSGDWSYFVQPYSATTKFIKKNTPCS